MNSFLGNSETCERSGCKKYELTQGWPNYLLSPQVLYLTLNYPKHTIPQRMLGSRKASSKTIPSLFL